MLKTKKVNYFERKANFRVKFSVQVVWKTNLTLSVRKLAFFLNFQNSRMGSV